MEIDSKLEAVDKRSPCLIPVNAVEAMAKMSADTANEVNHLEQQTAAPAMIWKENLELKNTG